ncbi:alpha-tectorin [Labeo rohita]|uniref:alpha-tectorin n=1 Tax=Labeo rohita TaxID=84645 RepID=UPI0021E2FBA1|nr:alpha-tectorin [Labeo rohita]
MQITPVTPVWLNGRWSMLEFRVEGEQTQETGWWDEVDWSHGLLRSKPQRLSADPRWSPTTESEITEAQVPANFLPYGHGDTVNPISDDGSSGAISLQQPFKYFGRTHSRLFVNNNGFITFTEQMFSYVPFLNSRRDIIAPMWTDLDNRRGGTISYREDTSSAVLVQVTAAVKQYFPNIPFTATSAFVATWDSVPYYSGGGAGYYTMDSVNSFTIPAAGVPELSSSSNINENGRWSFRVDGSPNLPTMFLPFGDREVLNPPSEDGSSDVIYLQQTFKYFGRSYNQIFVNNNGYLTFTEPLSAYDPSLVSARDIIAPLWTRLDNRQGGTISYREDTRSAVLAQVTAAVKQYFPNIPFAATTAFVATWDSVPYHNGGGVVSFQVVLAYNVHRSFILIYYGDNAETGQPWLAGYSTMDSVSSFTVPAAGVPELSSGSNINVNGCWSFSVDGSSNLPVNFLPFGNEETVTPRLEDGSSEAITLQRPLKFFRRTHHQIFVNNNGYLTFTEPLSAYVPILNSGRDIIAPLWTRLDNRQGGTISYREDTSSAVLAQVTAAVQQYFPNIPFAATSAFVATWDSVPYYSGGGVATFQVVLVSSVHRSFILINYGDIAETEQIWQAGYSTVNSVNSFTIPVTSAPELSSSSNINVNGRWSFHVDGSPNFCDTLGCTGNEVCRFRDAYGCGCLEGQRPNPKTFDAIEFCASSTGTMSLSRCQLFESDVPFETLHLNDPSCSGTLENDRVLFHFDNEGHVCGTTLTSNSTHFIYQNSIQSNLPAGVITRERWMNIAFSCAYPLIQTLSMPMGIKAEQGVVSIDLPGQGTYHIRMIPYNDAQFTSPYEGNVEVQVNQQIYVAVEVEGVDRSQIAAVLDNCWATPVNDSDFQIRWNLIVRECPNPEDGTVEVLQNGIDTTSRFSFRMFTFTRASDRIFLHCQVHLCLVQNGRCAQSCHPGNRRRRRRSLDSYHSAAITMGF